MAGVAAQTNDYFDLLEAFRQEGCPVCRVALKAMARALDIWQYEGFTDVGDRETLVQARGFCSTHTWELARMGALFQLGLAYRTVLQTVAEELVGRQKRVFSSQRWSRVLPGWLRRRWFRPSLLGDAQLQRPPCPLCSYRSHVEVRLLGTLLDHLEAAEFHEALARSEGLCLLHFELACIQSSQSARQQLQALQQSWVERLLAELEEFLRKHDYRFLDEPRGAEMRAWRWACDMLASKPMIR